MKLRAQMLTLSLATLLVPAFGWLLLQELEQFLREGQERTLAQSARTIARSLPPQFQTDLFGREGVLPLRAFDSRPVLDGYASDWSEANHALVFEPAVQGAVPNEPMLNLLGGRWESQDYLFLTVQDSSPLREGQAGGASTRDGRSPGMDSVILFLRSGRGLTQYRIQTAAPGPLLVTSQTPGGGQIAGFWFDTDSGYRLELALPPRTRALDLSIGVEDAYVDSAGVTRTGQAGSLRDGRPISWMALTVPDVALSAWLRSVAPESTRAWVVDHGGWVVADTGEMGSQTGRNPSWVERLIYRTVVGGELPVLRERAESMVAFRDPLVSEALAGEIAQQWGGDPETAAVRNTVAVPLGADGVLGALVIEADTDGALLFTNRALGRLLWTSLLLTFALAAGLWFLAARLSRRVRSLSGAVSDAMADAANPRELPLTGDKDELGELARNNARLLRAVRDYTRYLRTLAGRLSHELKTPLAITRSSLDNLASETMGGDAQRFLERAREGLDRQTAIVRAMSEASRLESAVASAEWETVDLVQLLTDCTEGYRAVNPSRNIDHDLAPGPMLFRCAPDLLVQAIDKLVDNAISLTGDSDRITIGLVEKGNWRHIKVSNTGTELPATLQEQLFDSLVSMRDPGDQGLHLGLGLHIVRLVAEAHRGSAEAANLPDQGGVVFTLHLPAS